MSFQFGRLWKEAVANLDGERKRRRSVCEMGPVIKERHGRIEEVSLQFGRLWKEAVATLDGERRRRRTLCDMGPVSKERHGR